MNHIAAIQKALPDAGLDGVLLTCRANRFYAVDFDSTGTDGACLITPDHAWYWTDSRYIESAGKRITGADVGLTDRAIPTKTCSPRLFGTTKLRSWALTRKP